MKTLISSVLLKDISSDHVRDFSKENKEPSWVLELRLTALTQFQQIPWPSKNDERWKRTELNLLKWDSLTWNSSTSGLLEKIEVSDSALAIPFEKAIVSHPEEIKYLWSSMITRAANNKFMSLALALGSNGTCLFTKKNSTAVQFKRTISGGDAKNAYFPLNFIVVESGPEAQMWDDFGFIENDSTESSFISNVTGVWLKENAQASYYALQHWDENRIQFQFHDVIQERASRWNSIAVGVGGRIFHNESTMNLQGEGAENKVLGILFGDEKQNFENWVTQNHLARKTISDIQYRGALKGSSKSFFSGMVSIVKAAQQSDAYQSSKSLLLSEEARADAIPNLEILADDVKCSHGAAVGPVDEEQKFYLQTRGVSPQAAEEAIVQGFFEPVIAGLPSETVQEQLRQFIEKKLSK